MLWTWKVQCFLGGFSCTASFPEQRWFLLTLWSSRFHNAICLSDKYVLSIYCVYWGYNSKEDRNGSFPYRILGWCEQWQEGGHPNSPGESLVQGRTSAKTKRGFLPFQHVGKPRLEAPNPSLCTFYFLTRGSRPLIFSISFIPGRNSTFSTSKHQYVETKQPRS